MWGGGGVVEEIKTIRIENCWDWWLGSIKESMIDISPPTHYIYIYILYSGSHN
jgi:hypothetical protein